VKAQDQHGSDSMASTTSSANIGDNSEGLSIEMFGAFSKHGQLTEGFKPGFRFLGLHQFFSGKYLSSPSTTNPEHEQKRLMHDFTN
jgi:hypothetical protein